MKKLYILFAMLSVFAMNAQIIVIDAGHGYGSTVSNNPDGRTATEIETNLAVALKTQALIQSGCSSLTVKMTRTTNVNGWISVNQRAEMSNNWNADRLLSIHCNGGGGTGTETFYCTADDPNTAPDIAFSKKIQADMVVNGSWADRRCVEDASFLPYHLGVLKYSSATACLSEIGFVDTTADAAKLNNDTWRNKFAASYFNSLKVSLNVSCNATPLPGSFTLTATPQCVSNTSSILLTWTASANASKYDIYRNGTLYASDLTGTTFDNTYVTSGTTYTYYIKAKNATGSTNNSNGTLSRTAACAPGAFTLTATPACSGGDSVINLSWTTSASATAYDIYRNGSLYASDLTTTSFANTYITTGTTYTYYIKAKNASGSINNSNGTLSRTATCVPGAFTVTTTAVCSGSTSAINVTWTASANATTYDIYRNGNLYAPDVTGTEFLNTYLINAGQTYTFSMVAKNASGTIANSNGTRSSTAISCVGKRESTDFSMTSEIVIYPNPSSDFINLQISNVANKKVDVNIYDINGRLVKRVEVNPSQDSVEQRIDISTFSNGTYFMNGIIDNKEFVKKFIKK